MTPARVTASRRRAVRRLVAGGTIASQRQLVELLAGEGFAVTQATVSRDLDSIGSLRVALPGGGYRYRIGGESGNGSAALARLLAEFVEAIVPTGNLVVLRTPPGAAQVVASAIDQSSLPGLVGTVAGDDTVLAVAEERTGGRGLAAEFERIGACS